jgi:hypothetical protein
MIDIDALVGLVDRVWRQAFGKPLAPLERSLLQGCLQGKPYTEIAAETGLPPEQVRLVGDKFWSDLSKTLGKTFTCRQCSTTELVDAVFSYLDIPSPSPPPQAPRVPLPPSMPLPDFELAMPEPVEESVVDLSDGEDDQTERYSGFWNDASELLDTLNTLENELYLQPFVRAGEPESREPTRGIAATDLVDCSVFGPNAIALNEDYLIQVFVHLPDQFDLARQRALLADPEAQARATKTLAIAIERNSQLTFELLLPGLAIDTPVQSLTWRGQPASVEFGVAIPASLPRPTVIGTVIVSQNSVPLGQLKFKLAVGQPTQEAVPMGHAARRFRKAFVSYSSKDRLEVLKRVQALLLADIEVFQDVLNLEPGDRWEQQLYRQIAGADVFFLFWSNAAKESKWVIKEALYALECQGGKEDQPPEIIPVILEGPPTIPPPPELSHLHFQDRLAYVMAATR